MTELESFVSTSPLCDTHEHLRSEERWIREGPDILTDIFGAYLQADLHSAGAAAEALGQLNDSSDPDLLRRFRRADGRDHEQGRQAEGSGQGGHRRKRARAGKRRGGKGNGEAVSRAFAADGGA